MGQLDWVPGCSDIWSSNILMCPWGCFWMNLIWIWIGRLNLNRQIPQCGWAASNRMKVWINQKGWPSQLEFFLLDSLQTETLALPGCQACWPLDRNSAISSPACWLMLQILGFLTHHNCDSQLWIISLSLSLTSLSHSLSFPLLCFSGKHWYPDEVSSLTALVT